MASLYCCFRYIILFLLLKTSQVMYISKKEVEKNIEKEGERERGKRNRKSRRGLINKKRKKNKK